MEKRTHCIWSTVSAILLLVAFTIAIGWISVTTEKNTSSTIAENFAQPQNGAHTASLPVKMLNPHQDEDLAGRLLQCAGLLRLPGVVKPILNRDAVEGQTVSIDALIALHRDFTKRGRELAKRNGWSDARTNMQIKTGVTILQWLFADAPKLKELLRECEETLATARNNEINAQTDANLQFGYQEFTPASN